MSEAVSTYEFLPAVLRGYEHTAGETCKEENLSPADMCIFCRSAHEIEYLYKEFTKFRQASQLYQKMTWGLSREAEAWREVAHNLLRAHGDPAIIGDLTDTDIDHMLQAEYGKVSNKS